MAQSFPTFASCCCLARAAPEHLHTGTQPGSLHESQNVSCPHPHTAKAAAPLSRTRAAPQLTHTQERLRRRIASVEVKVMNEPRPGKKCLVLDIDYTLFDLGSSAERAEELARCMAGRWGCMCVDVCGS